jgi:hypothetical protein
VCLFPAGAKPYSTQGYLESAGDEQYFEVYAGSDTYIEVTFDFPYGVDFWVDVYGQYGNLLGSYDPRQGETIQLSGGGKFTIYVTSEGGNGAWSAYWEIE